MRRGWAGGLASVWLVALGAAGLWAGARGQGQSNCSFSSPDGNYQIEWELDPETLLVTFGIDTKPERMVAQEGSGVWTGLMIGPSMAQGDFLVVQALWSAERGDWEVSFRDMRSGGGYAAPVDDGPGKVGPDGVGDHIVNAQGRVVDGRIYARFSRPLQTKDPGDISLTECDTVLGFPTSGGQLFPDQGRLFLGRHFIRSPPQVRNICIPRDCAKAPATRAPPPTRRPPPREPDPRLPNRQPLQGLGGQAPRGAAAQRMPEIRCSAAQNDHSSCFGYLEEYFRNVTVWAEQNAFEAASQFPRACGLLVKAQNGLIKAVCCRNLSEKFCRQGANPFQ